MKFYITVEGTARLKRSFLNLKLYSVINMVELLEQHGYTFDNIDEYGAFIVTTKFKSLIKNYSKSKRIRGIIYCNPYLNEEIIENLSNLLGETDVNGDRKYEKITEMVLLDDYYVPKLKHFYGMFPEIIFFPSVKKIRLIECKPVTDHVEWKDEATD